METSGGRGTCEITSAVKDPVLPRKKFSLGSSSDRYRYQAPAELISLPPPPPRAAGRRITRAIARACDSRGAPGLLPLNDRGAFGGDAEGPPSRYLVSGVSRLPGKKEAEREGEGETGGEGGSVPTGNSGIIVGR